MSFTLGSQLQLYPANQFLISNDPSIVVERIGDYPVACGGYSDVWRGLMTLNGEAPVQVALKFLRPTHLDKDRLRKHLEREILCWKPLDHTNVAPFYGVVYQSNYSPVMVTKWYDNGTADVYLKTHPIINPMEIILEITAGIEYLHEMGIIHGDLKGANVMIDDQGHAKLIDFGLARLKESEAGLTTSTMCTVRWCAPELLRSDCARTTTASDVYAFASTALELLTGDIPYSRLGNRTVPLAVINGETPRSLSSTLRYNIRRSPELWALLEKCWDETARRPSIMEVRSCLKSLYS